MTRKNGAETKRQRIEEIIRMLRVPVEQPLDYVIAQIIRKHGLTSSRALQYLEEIQSMRLIVIDKDKQTVSWTGDPLVPSSGELKEKTSIA